MNATKSTPTQSETVERIMHEHDALRDKLRRMHSVLAEPNPERDEIDLLLRGFLDALVIHFSREEEDDGFFAEVTAHAPRLSHSAAKLCVEHRHLLHEADELCRFAAAGCPSMPWWRELQSRYDVFSKRLMNHECEENKLLHEAHKVDIGAYD